MPPKVLCDGTGPAMVEADNTGKEVGIKMGELIIPNAIWMHADNDKEAVDNTGSVLMNILAHIIIQAEITCFNKQSL